jgi:hypothetical protein
MLRRTSLLLVLAVACASQPPPDPCSAEALADIQAEYVAAAAHACEGTTLLNCPELPALKRERDARVAGWVRCSR